MLKSLLRKVAGLWACNFTQKRLQHRRFSVNIEEFLRIAIFIEHLWWLLECRVITLKEVQVASAAFPRFFFRKIFLNSWSIGRRISTAKSDFSRVVTATLLLSLSVMDNFLEILQKFRKIVFQYKKELSSLFLKLTSHADTSLVGVRFLLSFDYNRISTSKEVILG